MGLWSFQENPPPENGQDRVKAGGMLKETWWFPKFGVPSWVLIIRESYYLGFYFRGPLFSQTPTLSYTPNPQP